MARGGNGSINEAKPRDRLLSADKIVDKEASKEKDPDVAAVDYITKSDLEQSINSNFKVLAGHTVQNTVLMNISPSEFWNLYLAQDAPHWLCKFYEL